MSTTTIPAALAYLVTTATNTWATDQSVYVFDGPPPVGFNLEFPTKIWIGCDPTKLDAMGDEVVAGDYNVATLTQGRTLQETYSIVCAVEHWDGGTDLNEARAAAFSYFATFENFVRGLPGSGGPGDTTMGGALGTAGWSQVSGGLALYQEQQSPGCDVVIVFHVSCTARLT
jgi:hypothetical protein